jgi:hypothetical protein
LGYFSPRKQLHNDCGKNGLGYILGVFSQPHLVALLVCRLSLPWKPREKQIRQREAEKSRCRVNRQSALVDKQWQQGDQIGRIFADAAIFFSFS